MITRKQRSVISILAALCTTGYTLNHQAFAQGSAPPTAIPASQKNHAVQENIGWAPVKYTGKHITALGGYKLTVPFNVSPGIQVAARAYIQAYVPQDGLILFFLFFQSTSERSLVNNIRNNPASFIGLPANAFKITKNAYSDTTQYNGNWLDFIHIVANGKETRFTFSGNNAFKGPPPAAWLGRENPTFGQPRILSVLVSSNATTKSANFHNTKSETIPVKPSPRTTSGSSAAPKRQKMSVEKVSLLDPRAKTLNSLYQLHLYTMMYESDNGQFPDMSSPETVKTALLRPYAKNDYSDFVDAFHHRPFMPNPALSHTPFVDPNIASLKDRELPANTIEYYQSQPMADGTRAVSFARLREKVAYVSIKKWSELKKNPLNSKLP